MPAVRAQALALALLAACASDPDGRGGTIPIGTVTVGNLSSQDVFTVPAGAPDAGMTIVADPWTIQLTPGLYTVRLCTRGTEPQGVLDPMVQVFGPSGYVGQGNDNLSGMNALYVLTVTTPGMYTLVARAVSGAAPPSGAEGNYAMRIDPGNMPLATCPLQ